MKISTIKNRDQISSILKKFVILLFWILVWQVIYKVVNKDILVPSPSSVFTRLSSLVKMQSFWLEVTFSMLRVLIGFISGVFIGTFLSLLTSYLGIFRDVFKPVLYLIKATPVASFIILALVWLHSGIVPVFVSMLMVIPIVWANVTEGIAKTDYKLLEMSRVFKVSKMKRLQTIYLPSVMPYFMASCITALGFSWKSEIAAEIISNTRNSLGSEIYKSKIYIETVDLFAYTVVVIILSIILEYVVVRFLRSLFNRFDIKKG